MLLWVFGLSMFRCGLNLCHRVNCEESVDGVSRLAVHPLQNVAVDVKRNTDRRVTQAFGNYFGMDSLLKKLRGMRVPEIVESNTQAFLLCQLTKRSGKCIR